MYLHTYEHKRRNEAKKGANEQTPNERDARITNEGTYVRANERINKRTNVRTKKRRNVRANKPERAKRECKEERTNVQVKKKNIKGQKK